ncbi:hypothetical protein V1477_008697 [Vespula maculifrons]|uniref:Uncharacterized protein n=2 Tax=Vespula TaxID=7451 RepID=A0A834JT85_VESVU|nr:hypothetical protein HZH66_009561 [Vespula vulgaris]
MAIIVELWENWSPNTMPLHIRNRFEFAANSNAEIPSRYFSRKEDYYVREEHSSNDTLQWTCPTRSLLEQAQKETSSLNVTDVNTPHRFPVHTLAHSEHFPSLNFLVNEYSQGERKFEIPSVPAAAPSQLGRDFAQTFLYLAASPAQKNETWSPRTISSKMTKYDQTRELISPPIARLIADTYYGNIRRKTER